MTETPLGDRRNMVYAGTHVTAGRARAVVVATGLDTELGRIAALASGAEVTRTPLERRIAQFGRYVIIAGIAMFSLVVGIGLARGLPAGQVLMVGISQLVTMISEGLPVAMTIALAVGVQRMARRRAVIRRLAAVETLGATTIICTDKTGTLTKNEMTATAVVMPNGRTLAVTGIGYAAEGELVEDGQPLTSIGDDERQLLESAVLCNDAPLYGPTESRDEWSAVGDPTEIALVTLGVKAGIVPADIRARFARAAEIPFDPVAKMMATQHRGPQASFVIVKGAPEIVLERCRAARFDGRDIDLDRASRAQLLAAIDAMAGRALRVLAIGRVDNAEIDGNAGLDAFGGRITLLGFVGQIDPPRPEVKDAVARCVAAGIRADVGVAMGVTGTEVAKEASKVVITDDNFATIVSAVEEGRVGYRNIKKTILYLSPFDLGEALAIGAVGSIVLWVEELRKLIARHRAVAASPPAVSSGSDRATVFDERTRRLTSDGRFST